MLEFTFRACRTPRARAAIARAIIISLILFAGAGAWARAAALIVPLLRDAAVQHLYVSEPDSHRILRYQIHNGIPAQSPDAVIGGLQRPHGLAIGPDGRLYVVDAKAEQLLIYERSPGTGATPSHVLALPHSSGLGAVGVDSLGFVYVGYQLACSYLGPCSDADVYRPLPSGTQKPFATYFVGSSPPDAIASALVIDPRRHFAEVSNQQMSVFDGAPNSSQQTAYPLFCGAETPWAAVWGPGNEIDTTDLGSPSNPPRPSQVVIVPDYLHGKINNCPAFYTITSATVPLNAPRGIARTRNLLYVTSAFDAKFGSALVFVFDATKPGAQTPFALLGGPGSHLLGPWAIAIGP